MRPFQTRVDTNFYDAGISVAEARCTVCLHDCEQCANIEFPCPFKTCPQHRHSFPTKLAMLRHIAEHPANEQAAFVGRRPEHCTCSHCPQPMAEGGECHDRCMQPLMFSANLVETDEERDERFSGQFLSQFNNAFFAEVADPITDNVARSGSYRTITRPRMGDSIAGWVRMGYAKLNAAYENPALPPKVRDGAYKLMLVTPALLFHQSQRMETVGRVHGAAITV